MNGFISKDPIYVSGYKFTRFMGTLFFISSVAAYAYATQYLLLEFINLQPNDSLMYVFAGALGVCWIGTVLLMGKWFRFYQTYKPGLPSLAVSILPLFIIPLAWGAYELIKLAESYL
ncbi:hypothetical protein GW777_05730 [Candidatus Peregrinibacteria bacterium]|nr:hypothetical protein [bacterium]NCQ55787.1 hypothetical protein [Candidatus Parcubacteria bacterium]NCS67854.1 hypothetical protein [Candidatus Peregrinibacteria bacterium]